MNPISRFTRWLAFTSAVFTLTSLIPLMQGSDSASTQDQGTAPGKTGRTRGKENKKGQDMSKLPPEFRYDTPPKARTTVMPVYPYALARDNVKGSAKVVLSIDAAGHVVETAVISATQPEFGLATVAAVENFSFEPAIRDAKPVPSVLRYEQEFTSAKLIDASTAALLAVEKKNPDTIVRADKLDAPLTPVTRKGPVLPRSLLGNPDGGSASIEIMIDGEGKARLPRIVSATDPAFGYAAAQAAAAWTFEPPKAGGKPVVTRVQIPFHFKANLPPPAASDK
jgi:TonB family protein